MHFTMGICVWTHIRSIGKDIITCNTGVIFVILNSYMQLNILITTNNKCSNNFVMQQLASTKSLEILTTEQQASI